MPAGDTARKGPRFRNALVIEGRLVAAPETVPNKNSEQISFVLAHPYSHDKAYFIDVMAFDDVAVAARDGGVRAEPLGKGDSVTIIGKLKSYRRPVKGASGSFNITRVIVVAESIERKKKAKPKDE